MYNRWMIKAIEGKGPTSIETLNAMKTQINVFPLFESNGLQAISIVFAFKELLCSPLHRLGSVRCWHDS